MGDACTQASSKMPPAPKTRPQRPQAPTRPLAAAMSSESQPTPLPCLRQASISCDLFH